MIDQTLLGSTVAKCMDSIEADPPETECAVIAVGLVVVCGDADTSWTRTYCSPLRTYEQVGLFRSALDCVENGD